jgi:hypothetical protein
MYSKAKVGVTVGATWPLRGAGAGVWSSNT